MPRASQSGNRLLDERWRATELEQHHARLDSINAVDYQQRMATSSAKSSHADTARRVSPSPSKTSSSRVKLTARSQSPAAKARQAQIDRENLILIKKIVAIDNANFSSSSASGSSTTKLLPRRSNRPSSAKVAGSSLCQQHKRRLEATGLVDSDVNAIGIPSQRIAFETHVCGHPLPDVPSAVSHALYTRTSATMHNNFAGTNSSTLDRTARLHVRTAQRRIDDDNKRLLQRILAARTSYSRTQLSEQERARRKLLHSISRQRSPSVATVEARAMQPSSLSASTSRMPLQRAHEVEDADDWPRTSTGRQHATASRRHTSSSNDLAAMSIRLSDTSHLVPTSSPSRHDALHHARQRPLSASASTPLMMRPRAIGAESLVDRMRSMTVDQRLSGDSESDDDVDDEVDAAYADVDELLQELD